MLPEYVLGVDYGTDSVRVVVVGVTDGREEATEVVEYPRWREGRYCDPARHRFRQHPLDYLESLTAAVRGVLGKLPPGAAERVVGIGIDTTGSTPCAVDRHGMPLALLDEFKDNPNAMFILWKDHTAIKEAEEINHAAKSWGGTDFTRYEGGVYSAEWFWAKILHVLREDPAVRQAAHSWVEHCDWLPAVLTGTTDPKTMKRSRCAAGHKAMWHPSWGGLPPEEFLTRIDPLLAGWRERLYTETYTADQVAGFLTAEWAAKLGLRPGIPVAVGAFDAHMGAVGGGITEGALVKIMGTSTCDVMVASPAAIGEKLIAGICGQVDGSVIPGMIGLEAGQSSFGDVYAWFKRLLAWTLEPLGASSSVSREKETIENDLLPRLSREAAKLAPGEAGLLALDWLNGRRTPYADQALKGAIVGLTLGTTPPRFFRALVEATAFGARAINERFLEEGLRVERVIAMGGIAKKNEFVMEITADVLGTPIEVVRSEQACALGAAMFAAVAAGRYRTVQEAQAAMASGFDTTFYPRPENVEKYQKLYALYREVGRMLEGTLRSL
ncbi:MAG: ribulokinase [Firmicutes bacterium]|nr:ribulokinase [Bacillota bacterium]